MGIIVAIIGFLGGFALGLWILSILLRNRSRKDLLQDKSLHYSYGLLSWMLAILGAVAARSAYFQFFG